MMQPQDDLTDSRTRHHTVGYNYNLCISMYERDTRELSVEGEQKSERDC